MTITQNSGEPHQVSKVYYNQQFSKTRVATLHKAMLDAGLESPYAEWLENWKDRDDNFQRVTTRVHAAEYFPVRDQALRAHATQIDPDGPWFAVSPDHAAGRCGPPKTSS